MAVEMWFRFLQALTMENHKLALLLISFSLAGLSLFIMRRSPEVKNKLLFLRLHLVLLFSPLLFLALTWQCGMAFWSCSPMKTLVSIPASVLIAYIVGLVLIPKLYAARLGAKVLEGTMANVIAETKIAKLLGTIPRLFYINTPEPTAFVKTGRRPSIHLSVGLMDIMTPKELEAVMLHETYHLKVRSPEMKFSSLFSRFVSPFQWLNDDPSDDELEADKFAIRIQRTNRHIKSARRKISGFNRLQRAPNV